MLHITFGFFIFRCLETILTFFVHISNPMMAPLIREAASPVLCPLEPSGMNLGTGLASLSPVLLQLEEEPPFAHGTSWLFIVLLVRDSHLGEGDTVIPFLEQHTPCYPG